MTDVPRIVTGYDKEVAAFVCSQVAEIEKDLSKGWFTTMGIVLNDKLIAGVIFNEYRQTDIRETFASITPKWATKTTLRQMFTYPFITLGCRRMTGIIEKKNRKKKVE